MAWAKFFSRISRFACSSLVGQCAKRARRKFNKIGIIVRALLIPTRDGVHEAMAALVQPAQFWCSVEISGAQVWRGVPALWFTICTRSLVHYALSDAIMTRASELAVLVSWPQFTGVGCALCSLQFAWSACLVQSALHCRAIGIVEVTHIWTVFKEPK